MWVVELDGKTEGYAHLNLFEKDGQKRAYVAALYLTPAVIGGGLGKKLALLMPDQARMCGAKEIALHSTITAREFYRSLGFRDSGPEQFDEINGHRVRNYPMWMTL